MADASDSKSDAGNSVWVQVPSPAVKELLKQFLFYFISEVFDVKGLGQLNYEYLPIDRNKKSVSLLTTNAFLIIS